MNLFHHRQGKSNTRCHQKRRPVDAVELDDVLSYDLSHIVCIVGSISERMPLAPDDSHMVVSRPRFGGTCFLLSLHKQPFQH